MKTQPLKEHQAIYSVMVGFLKSLLEISLVLCTRNQISEMYKKRWAEKNYMGRIYGSKCEGSGEIGLAAAFLERMLHLLISSLI
jgi:hypothetical protein